MSGHSKWATIKRAKGANDIKRGKLFTKLSKAITIAVRQGGGVSDPDGNPRLRLAIDAARSANMPKENIERAIDRAVSKQGEGLTEALYEGFGPGGFSVIVEAVTDNKQRTIAEIKNIFDKNGGNLGAQGSVVYQFEKKGSIAVEKNKPLDDLFLLAVESNAEDIEDAGEEALIYTKPEDLALVREALLKQGVTIKDASLIWKPQLLVALSENSHAERALNFLERLEDLDDVQKVYANVDIPDELIHQISA